MQNVVVIGGGTGTYTVLTGIKGISDINITAIVSSADSGGSTGILRDHFGQLPVGDFRQCLVALAENEDGNNLLRELFQYRFDRGGKGLKGHNFGNLFLTALSDILGNEELALQKASRILNIQGRVFPVTYDDIQLVAEYENGSTGYGEAYIDEPAETHNGKMRIKKLWVDPEATISYRAQEAILDADLIVLGPGDLYTSTLANIVVEGVAKSIRLSNTHIIYITNLVSKWGQTHNFKTSDYVDEIETYIGQKINNIIINETPLSKKGLKKYFEENAYPVEDNIKNDPRVIYGDFLYEGVFVRKEHDKAKRSLIRHDSYKLSDAIEKILQTL